MSQMAHQINLKLVSKKYSIKSQNAQQKGLKYVSRLVTVRKLIAYFEVTVLHGFLTSYNRFHTLFLKGHI